MTKVNGKADLYSMTLSELSDFLKSIGEPAFRAKQISAWLTLGTPISEMTNLGKGLREKLSELMLKTGELATDVGSVIYGEEAVEVGLIDRIGGLSDALDCLHAMMEEQKKEGEERG